MNDDDDDDKKDDDEEDGDGYGDGHTAIATMMMVAWPSSCHGQPHDAAHLDFVLAVRPLDWRPDAVRPAALCVA